MQLLNSYLIKGLGAMLEPESVCFMSLTFSPVSLKASASFFSESVLAWAVLAFLTRVKELLGLYRIYGLFF